jgi:thioredoxin-like negative regulator of GroEL
LKPWLLETAEKYDGKAKFVAVDVDKSEDVAGEYNIEAMPTFVQRADRHANIERLLTPTA